MVRVRVAIAVRLMAVALAALPSMSWASNDWPFSKSDIAPDPAVRFGALPNGLRYALMRNATPKGVVSIRLRIDAGSLAEADDQQGLAHFLEHMAFRGSTHVPEADVWRDLQRLGMTVGADANAFTSFTATTYKFDLPRNDPETLAAGLIRMRETASELTLSQAAMDAERGVVQSEMRISDLPNLHAFKDQLAFILKGQRLPTRLPIGAAGVLAQAPVSRIADFYHAYYRPERATLVVVGDIDVDAVEAQVKARFGDWKGQGRKGADPDPGSPAPRTRETRIFTEAGVQPSIQLSWIAPYDPSPETEAKDRASLVERIGFAVLNYRLQAAATGTDRPFLGAAAARQNFQRSARLTQISINPDPGRFAEGLKAAETMRRQILEFGVRPDEVQRAITSMRTAQENAVAGVATARSPRIADRLTQDVDAGTEIPTSPAQNLAQLRRNLEGLTAEEVTASLRKAFSGSGPLIFAASPEPLNGGDKALDAALAAADAATLQAPAAEKAVTWPYTTFGLSGQVVDRQEIADLGVTKITFSNGVRLWVKPTKHTENQVIVLVGFGQGRQGEALDRKPPFWAISAFVSGGLKELPYEDLRRALAGKTYGIALNRNDRRFTLSGSTKASDLPLEMQLLGAYLTAPAWRESTYERIRSLYASQLPQLDTSPQGALAKTLSSLLHDGDRRWSIPDQAEVRAASLDDLKAALTPALSQGPIEVTLVGDLTVEQAIAATADTLGALPPRSPSPTPAADASKVRFPAPRGEPLVLHHHGRADKAVAFIAWPATDFYADMKQSRALDLLERVLNQRLLEQLRIADGVTYSPSTELDLSDSYPGYGLMAALSELPPDKVSLFYDTVARIAADLRNRPVSPDELERARGPVVARLSQAERTNDYWTGVLSQAQVDPRMLDRVRTRITMIQAVTADDVQAAARAFLKEGSAWKVVVLPEPGKAGAVAGGESRQ